MDSGLRKRPTYEQLINYIEKDIKIKLPNRDAIQLRNSPYMIQLDNFVDTNHETNVNNNTTNVSGELAVEHSDPTSRLINNAIA